MRRRRKNLEFDVDPRYPAWTAPMKPAPGDLRFVQAFVNTADRKKGTDELSDPRSLAQWLASWRLANWRLGPEDAAATRADLERAVAVREALYDLIRTGGSAKSAFETINRAAARSPLFVRFEADGSTRLEPFAEGLDGALGRLFAVAASALRDDLWSRLKVCGHPDCRRVFYDHAPNRVGNWCTKLCANRINSQAFRRRNPR